MKGAFSRLIPKGGENDPPSVNPGFYRAKLKAKQQPSDFHPACKLINEWVQLEL